MIYGLSSLSISSIRESPQANSRSPKRQWCLLVSNRWKSIASFVCQGISGCWRKWQYRWRSTSKNRTTLVWTPPHQYESNHLSCFLQALPKWSNKQKIKEMASWYCLLRIYSCTLWMNGNRLRETSRSSSWTIAASKAAETSAWWSDSNLFHLQLPQFGIRNSA